LVRSLLEIVASQAVGSLFELGIFVKSTLKYELANLNKCHLCSSGFSHTHSLFEKQPTDNSRLYFLDFINKFEVKKFIDLEKIPTNYSCKTCLLAFSLDVMAYLQKKHFLIIENAKILPTPLGKAAFASSIPPEES
jgi:hypothetical protein